MRRWTNLVELRRIVEMAGAGRGEVLVTLVRAEGSSYRRAGARLLIGADDAYAGTISGGCLEAEVTRKARWLVRNGAVVERYSTLFDDTAEIPYGLGCGGTVDLLFEPVGTAEGQALLAAMARASGGAGGTVVTLLPGDGAGLRRVVFDAGGEEVFRSPGFEDLEGAGVYRETMEVPQRLVVFGAGDDAIPVVRMAGLMGWDVVVADGRRQMARAERFPGAREVRVLRAARACAAEVGVTEADVVVVMTHSYEQDRDCLASLLGHGGGQRYLGILGARHRTALLVEEVAAGLGRGLGECCGRIHAPVGLDLGGDGPEAIALAIVAEIQALLHGRLAASRRLTEEEVREQLARHPARRYEGLVCAASTQETASPDEVEVA